MSKSVVVGVLISVLLLSGCASLRHKPPKCKGPVHHINPEKYYQDKSPEPPTVKVPAEQIQKAEQGGTNEEE